MFQFRINLVVLTVLACWEHSSKKRGNDSVMQKKRLLSSIDPLCASFITSRISI